MITKKDIRSRIQLDTDYANDSLDYFDDMSREQINDYNNETFIKTSKVADELETIYFEKNPMTKERMLYKLIKTLRGNGK